MFRVLLCLILAFAGAARAQDVVVDLRTPLQAHGWEELRYDGKTPNEWSSQDGALVVETDRSVSTLLYRLDVDPARTPWLVWRWRVDASPGSTDLREKGGDDRAISLEVAFAWDPDNAGFFETARRQIAVAIEGEDLPGRVISYVFGGLVPRGTVYEHPYAGSCCRHKVLRQSSGATIGRWIEERVNLAADYRAAFDAPAPAVVGISLSADSDDTGTKTRARVADLRFTEPAP